MRLTCLLLAIGCTGLQLLMAHPGHSQDLTEVRVTLELKNEPLKMAFARIERQTDFRFAYNREQIDRYKSITLARASYPLQKALELLLANTHLSFKQVSNKIIVFQVDDTASNRTAAELAAALVVMADGTIKGKITNDKGEPVVGASVLLVGADKGTAAGLEGEFAIVGVKPGKYKLQVSAIGFQNIVRDITVADGQALELNFQLKAGGNAMDEVVVTGYSRQSKRDVTGAASTISADVVAQTPVTDVTGVLQGRAAGVTVDGQGGPGNTQVIRIRGIGTLGNNDPLYVIDGVQIRVGNSTSLGSQNISNLLNPNDIESITILKDPSLISLYGAEGSNGVVVITTKSGKMGAPKLEYSGYVGSQRPRKLPSMITPQQQADALYNSYRNATPAQDPVGQNGLYGTGATPVLPDYIIETPTSSNLGVPSGDPAANPDLYNFTDYRILKANKTGANWWKELYKPALTQNHQISISGATDKNSYAVTFGYLDDKGILLNSYFKRLSLRVNTQFKIKPWLRVGENVELSYSSVSTVSSHTDQNDIAGIYQMSPLLPTHDITGNLAGTKGAPFLGSSSPLTGRTNALGGKNYTESMIGSAYLEAEPIKGLVYQNQIGFQLVPNQYHGFTDTLPQEPFGASFNQFTEGSSYYTDWRWLNKLSWSGTFNGIHRITAFAAFEARQFIARSSYGTTTNILYATPNNQYLGNGNTTSPSVGGGGDQYTNVSQFGNLTYSLLDKYLFTGTIRHDGSSKFGPDKKYGTFGAVSGGWRISKEKFMDNVHWINDLKLRASYGSVGNDAIPSYAAFTQISGGPAYGSYDLSGTNTSAVVGYYPYSIGNPSLHWEANNSTNIGFDATLFNNKLNANFSWFDKKTKGLLYAPPSTANAGDALPPYENVMDFSNKGVELELGYNDHVGKLRYEMSFNIATYRSKVDYIDGNPASFILGGSYLRQYNLSRNMVGHPISSFYGYVYEGIFQSSQEVAGHATETGITPANGAGHIKFKDLNGDSVINDKDQTFLGNPNPSFTYGYSLNLYYKNFDLGILLQGVYGNKIFNYWRAYSVWGGELGAGSTNTWTPSNTSAKLPIYVQSDGSLDRAPSSLFVESGSYMRLKMLQLGYTLPGNKSFSKLRFYIQAFNLLTFTHYSGVDPEVNDGNPNNVGIDYGGAYPQARKFILGVNLGL